MQTLPCKITEPFFFAPQCRLCSAKLRRHSFRGQQISSNLNFFTFFFYYFCKSLLWQRPLLPFGPLFKDKIFCVTVPLMDEAVIHYLGNTGLSPVLSITKIRHNKLDEENKSLYQRRSWNKYIGQYSIKQQQWSWLYFAQCINIHIGYWPLHYCASPTFFITLTFYFLPVITIFKKKNFIFN